MPPSLSDHQLNRNTAFPLSHKGRKGLPLLNTSFNIAVNACKNCTKTGYGHKHVIALKHRVLCRPHCGTLPRRRTSHWSFILHRSRQRSSNVFLTVGPPTDRVTWTVPMSGTVVCGPVDCQMHRTASCVGGSHSRASTGNNPGHTAIVPGLSNVIKHGHGGPSRRHCDKLAVR